MIAILCFDKVNVRGGPLTQMSLSEPIRAMQKMRLAAFLKLLTDRLDDKGLCAVYQVSLFLDDIFKHTRPQSWDVLEHAGALAYRLFSVPYIKLTWRGLGPLSPTTHPCDAMPNDLLNNFLAPPRGLNKDRRPAGPPSVIECAWTLLVEGERDLANTFAEKFNRQAMLDGVAEGYEAACEFILFVFFSL